MRRSGNSQKIKIIALFVVIALMMVWPQSSPSDTGQNKRFVYQIFWLGIWAGTAVLDFESTPEGIRIKTHTTSAPLISLFYKVDDTAQSILYPDGYPKVFTLKVRQGRHKRDKVTYFGRKKEGEPQKIVFNNIRDEEITEYFLDRQAYDPLSAFYAMTRWDLTTGHSSYIDIFDDEKLWNTEVRVLRREKVRVPAGEFDTIVVKPILQSEGIFPKTGDMYIWATDDENKLPVKLTSKAPIGHITALLVEGEL
jgi:hypothetical protein